MPEGTVVADVTPVDYGSLDEQGAYSLGAACVDPPEVRRFLSASGRGTPPDSVRNFFLPSHIQAASELGTSSPQVVAPTTRSFTFKVRPFFGWSGTSARLRSFFAEQEFELLAPVDERTIVDKHRTFCFRVSEAEAPKVVRAAAWCGFVSLRGSRASKPWAPARQKNCRQPNPPKLLKVALKEAFTQSRVIKRKIEVAKQAKVDNTARQNASVTQAASV